MLVCNGAGRQLGVKEEWRLLSVRTRAAVAAGAEEIIHMTSRHVIADSGIDDLISDARCLSVWLRTLMCRPRR